MYRQGKANQVDKSDLITSTNLAMSVIYFNKEVNSVKIIDMMGNVLDYFQNVTSSIDLSNYSEGTYILITKYKDKTSVRRIVKGKK